MIKTIMIKNGTQKDATCKEIAEMSLFSPPCQMSTSL